LAASLQDFRFVHFSVRNQPLPGCWRCFASPQFVLLGVLALQAFLYRQSLVALQHRIFRPVFYFQEITSFISQLYLPFLAH
jgi:hypothetical protein